MPQTNPVSKDEVLNKFKKWTGENSATIMEERGIYNFNSNNVN